MINLDIIEQEIRELEARGDTTYNQCERLSWLYTVKDHLIPKQATDSKTPTMYGSEFMQLASGVSVEGLLRIIDEHLEAIKLLYPKSYDAVLDRIRSLRYVN